MLKTGLTFILGIFLFSCNGKQNMIDSSLKIDATEQQEDSLKTLKQIVVSRKIKSSELNIIVYKSKRMLAVYFKDEKLIEYPCVLGFDPTGDKMQEGDGKTPEGKFKIKSMYAHKSWSYFIWFDYPNKTSYSRFEDRKKKGIISSTAKIGGQVGIHGVPKGNDEIIEKKIDWTLGCISLSTKNITDLFQSIGTETSIEILK